MKGICPGSKIIKEDWMRRWRYCVNSATKLTESGTWKYWRVIITQKSGLAFFYKNWTLFALCCRSVPPEIQRRSLDSQPWRNSILPWFILDGTMILRPLRNKCNRTEFKWNLIDFNGHRVAIPIDMPTAVIANSMAHFVWIFHFFSLWVKIKIPDKRQLTTLYRLNVFTSENLVVRRQSENSHSRFSWRQDIYFDPGKTTKPGTLTSGVSNKTPFDFLTLMTVPDYFLHSPRKNQEKAITWGEQAHQEKLDETR